MTEDEIRVSFLDVGEGDCTLIRTAEATLLVDTGEADPLLNAGIVATLRSLGVERIDCLVLTHPHSDHVGGAPAILEAFPVGECLMPLAADESDAFAAALDALLASEIPTREATRGYSKAYGDLTVEVLSPERDSGAADINDLSAVLRLTFGKATLLLMADAGKSTEEALLRDYPAEALSASLLKVGHHGADTSSSYAFLSAVSPTYAVLSVGSDNAYGHPGEATLRRLAAVGATVFRTDRHGDIVFTGTRDGFTPPETE